MGPWDIMSQHLIKKSEAPPGISSFTKIRLGWITPAQAALVRPGETRIVYLAPLSKKGKTLVVKIPLPRGRYYLLENRQLMGFDRVLPDSGILILEVDPNVREGSGTVRVMNAAPASPNFSRATFRLDRDNRGLYIDKDDNLAVVPLWPDGENLGVLITTSDRGPEALLAAKTVQSVLARFPEPRSGKTKEKVREIVASFKRHDFDSSYLKAMQLLNR